jgi:AcrR family transcriptional regulator
MPKIVDYNERRLEIGKIALSVLSIHGFEQTKMQDIADKAGIAKGSIYKYFASKHKLLDFLVSDFINKFDKILEGQLILCDSYLEKLKLIITISILMMHEPSEYFKIYIETWIYILKRKNTKIVEIFDNYLEKWLKTIENIIIEGQNHGVFKKDLDTKSTSRFISSSIDGIILHYLYCDGEFDLKKLADSFVITILEGIKKK